MKEVFIEFFGMQNPNVRYVVLGSVLLSISSAIVGCFTFLKKKALVGDVVSHAVLPGICLSFIVTGTKDPFMLIIGAFITGWLSILVMDYIVQNSKIKEDTATGLALSVFFGIGILLLTVIQHSGNAAQSGLDSFLFGKAAALIGKDLLAFGLIAIVILATVFLFYKEFKLICFDPDYAEAIGVPVKKMEMLLTSITVMAVVTGIQAVGVVLMAAMLITPAAAARFWSDRLSFMLVLASIFAALSGVSGAFISYTTPSMPTGPWIVMVLSLIAVFSFFFAPGKGIIIKLLKRRKIQMQLLEENLLKSFYKIGEITEDFKAARSNAELKEVRRFSSGQFREGLNRLAKQGFIKRNNGTWSLTAEGLQKGRRVVRLHRLWELYLTKYLRIAPDHVHEDAETIEHVITPELEARLEKLLEYPDEDPHSSNIPYN
ncbi:metal ABC transporter permease [Marinoscillum furvescens]|uniref:Manganese/zinc/iron transport system permease protein n=1 Tax=Marinoscillum furvescens DSM 4134 TaxID=1122208 RepID=A0A3D9KY67_MARFU|nr:iron chelate uptake ABC transporter family permease subunit [Marinoscillum furvescens]RED94349.1 manganese/zinc/iron transport system permease protein [Marinoscillum furvescens DSM 4134]